MRKAFEQRKIVVVGALLVAVGALAAGVWLVALRSDDERTVLISREAGGFSTDTKPPATEAVSIDDDGERITDAQIRRIAAAATAAAGGGRVTDIERSDDPGEAFEVEVVKGGVEIDVALDARLRRVPNRRFSD